MKFTQFKKQDEVRDTLVLEMMKNKIRKGESNFNNTTTKPSYSNNKNDVQDDIRFSVAFKGAVELAAGGVISVDEVESFTLKYDEFLKDKKSVEMPF
jgi:hypothetical protein